MRRGVDSLLVIFNYGLGAFPKSGIETEEALLTFLSMHRELAKLFAEVEMEEGK
jgi:hypothetical protein